MASIECCVCSDALSHDHGGVRCASDPPHHLCGDCSISFCSSKLNELSADAFPPACSMCSEPVTLASFDAHLNAEQRTRFLQVSLTHGLAESESLETIVRCPHCSYFETRSNAEHMNFVFCRREGCEKVSCTVCFKVCELPAEGNVPSLDQARLLGMERHFECKAWDSEFGESCSAFEEALSMGQTMACPTCMRNGVSSRAIKDDACTHMTCETCETVWCYLCGLDTASEECSKAPLEEDPQMSADYRHNVAWFSEEGRCPMYLNQVHELDPTWPADDRSALELFHRKRTLRLLKAVYDRIGQDAYRRMVAAVPRFGAACGFTEEEIRAVAPGEGYYARSDEFVPQNGREGEDEGRTELMDAAAEGDTERVVALLAAPGLDVNAADGDDRTALTWATAGGHLATVVALLAAPGIDVNAADGGGETPLMVAAEKGLLEIVKLLLAMPGINVSASDRDGLDEGGTALMQAMRGGYTEMVTTLLAAPGLNVSRELIRAATAGYTEAVTVMLAAMPGLDVNAADEEGSTALMLAAARGHTETATVLLAASGLDVNAVDGRGYTALMLAVMTALLQPLGRGAEVVTALLAAPGLNVNAANADGCTALILAAVGRTALVAALVAAPGLDVNAAGRAGRTALIRAAGGGRTETVTALLAVPGLDVNAADRTGDTALMRAAGGVRGHTETVTVLLAAPGLDVNAENRDGHTALMRAAAGGHTETVTALLAAPGIDANAAATNGSTALAFAEHEGHAEIASLLRARRCRSM